MRMRQRAQGALPWSSPSASALEGAAVDQLKKGAAGSSVLCKYAGFKSASGSQNLIPHV